LNGDGIVSFKLSHAIPRKRGFLLGKFGRIKADNARNGLDAVLEYEVKRNSSQKTKNPAALRKCGNDYRALLQSFSKPAAMSFFNLKRWN
jgi:hypothetical protein